MNIQHDGDRFATLPQREERGKAPQHHSAAPSTFSPAPGYGAIQLPFNAPFDTFAYSGMANPPMPPPWLAGGRPLALPHSQHEGAPSYAHAVDHQVLGQCKPFVTPAVAPRLGSNTAVDRTRALGALPYTAPYTAPGLSPSAPAVLPIPAAPAPNYEPTLWSNQTGQTSSGHPTLSTPIAMPFPQAHPGTVPGLARPLQHTTTTPQAPNAPPLLQINTNFTAEHLAPRQPQIIAPGSWSPWAIPCPEIVVDCDPSLARSPMDYPGSARSGTSSLSSHDRHHYTYLLAHQSPASGSSYPSPYSDLSVLTPSSLISMFDLDSSQNMLSNLVSHPESSAPNAGFDPRFLSTLSSSKSPHEGDFNSEAGPSSHASATELEDPPYPSTSALTAGLLQGLGQRNSSENSSDSTLRLSLGEPPYSGPAPALSVAQTAAASSNFRIPENNEDDDDPVPEYTETAAAAAGKKGRRKGEAISSVPLRECFKGDSLRRTLILRILAKAWLRAHNVEPVFLSRDDDVTRGLEKQVAWTFGMKKGESLFKAFEGAGGRCPFDGCPNVEPRAHRRISHVRTHFGLRPFACDPRGCVRCQARIERGLEVRRFYNPDGLREHSQPPELMDCAECGDRVLRNNMDRHLETKHGITKRRKFASRRKTYRSQRQR